MLVIEECYPIKKDTYNDLHFGDLFKWSIDSPIIRLDGRLKLNLADETEENIL